MPYTFGDLKDELRPLLWPQGEAENLVIPHNKFFEEAMVEIQRWVPCQQYNNTQIYRACSRFYQCGLTVMQAPSGGDPLRSIGNKIISVSVIDKINPTTRQEDATSPDDWCSKIQYTQVDFCKLEKYSQHVKTCYTCGGGPLAFADFSGIFGFPYMMCGKGNFPVPDDQEYLANPALPMGFHYQPQTSTNSRYGRAQMGVWALHRGRLYLAPWLQGTEIVIVEWDGLKNIWDDIDFVENNITLKRAVRYYVAWNHARDYDQDNDAAARAQDNWNEALKDLMRDCREETRVQGCEPSHARQAVIPQESQGGPVDQIVPEEATLQGQLAQECASVEPVSFDPPAGSVVVYPVYVVMTSQEGAEIFFTTDGTTPTRASYKYTEPVPIVSTAELKAIAFNGECQSEVTSAAYEEYVGDGVHESSFSRLCSTGDQAGQWFNFSPDGSADHIFSLVLSFPASTDVAEIDVFRTDSNGIWNTGRCWSTKYLISPPELDGGTFASFPLVVFKGIVKQQNAYTDAFGTYPAGQNFFTCFGETLGFDPDTYYKCVVTLGDGTKIHFFIGTLCSGGEPSNCATATLNDSDQFSVEFPFGTVINSGNTASQSLQLVWSYSPDTGKWVLGEIAIVHPDGSREVIDSINDTVIQPGYSINPGELIEIQSASYNGFYVSGCFTAPTNDQFPTLAPTPTPTPTPTSTATATPTPTPTPTPTGSHVPGSCDCVGRPASVHIEVELNFGEIYTASGDFGNTNCTYSGELLFTSQSNPANQFSANVGIACNVDSFWSISILTYSGTGPATDDGPLGGYSIPEIDLTATVT